MQFPGLAQSLVDLIRKKIVIGELTPGQKINEIELSKSLDISRSPLREALRILENEHLVTYSPRKGNSVSNVSTADFLEIYQIREMIECFAIDLLEEKNVQSFSALGHCVEQMIGLEIPSPDSSPESKLNYVETLSRFHLELVKATGNKRLFDTYVTIHSNINRYVFLYIFVQGVSEHRVNDHVEILEYLKNKKFKEARKAVRDHVRHSCEALLTNERVCMKNEVKTGG
jgi:DNA-binding GntR family transcriptional regulator